jgi:hypothetical protein
MLRVTDGGTASPFSAFGGAWKVNRGSGQDQASKEQGNPQGNPVDAPLPRLRLSLKGMVKDFRKEGEK